VAKVRQQLEKRPLDILHRSLGVIDSIRLEPLVGYIAHDGVVRHDLVHVLANKGELNLFGLRLGAVVDHLEDLLSLAPLRIAVDQPGIGDGLTVLFFIGSNRHIIISRKILKGPFLRRVLLTVF